MKAVIAGDEPLLAQHLRSRLAALWPELDIAGIAAMVVMTVVDCEMAGVLYRYLMDYSPVLLVGAALCWFCAEGSGRRC